MDTFRFFGNFFMINIHIMLNTIVGKDCDNIIIDYVKYTMLGAT